MPMARHSPRMRTDAKTGIKDRPGFHSAIQEEAFTRMLGESEDREAELRDVADRMSMLQEATLNLQRANRMLGQYGKIALRHEKFLSYIAEASTAVSLAIENDGTRKVRTSKC